MRLGSIILAGGESTRMGQPKAALPLGDGTFLSQTVDMLSSCTFPVVVVARDATQEADLPPIQVEVEVALDAPEHRGRGPLAGLVAGLGALDDRCDAAFVTGCDTPFVTPGMVEWLADQLGDNDLVVPRVDDVVQPLCGVYRLSVAAAARARLDGDDTSLLGLARNCKTRFLDRSDLAQIADDLRFLRSINSPEDYDALRDSDSDDTGPRPDRGQA